VPKLISILVFLLVAYTGTAQTSYTIKGTVTDSLSANALSFATVSILSVKDNQLIDYTLTDGQGRFNFRRVTNIDNIYVSISFVGFRTMKIKPVVEDGKRVIDIGVASLTSVYEELEKITVNANRPPIQVKNDTIQFNAEHIQTVPGAMVEELLKRIIGVYYDSDGKLYFNGKPVNEIKVDGKDFFSGDMRIATQNLPASIIDNVQLFSKDGADRNSNVTTGETYGVINLTLKKSAKKGWIGAAYAGAGTSDRYDVGGIANRFRDTLSVSAILMMNNSNKSGFTFKSQQNYNPGGKESVNTNASLQSIVPQGSLPFFNNDAGIADSRGGGFNINYAPTANRNTSFQYFFGVKDLFVVNRNSSIENIGNTIFNRFFNSSRKTKTKSHTIIAAHKKRTALSEFSYKLNVSAASSAGATSTENKYMNNLSGLLSENTGEPSFGNSTLEINQELNYFRTFAKNKRRKFSVVATYKYYKGESDFYSRYFNYFYVPIDDTTTVDQYRKQLVPGWSFSLMATYTEPLSKRLSLKFSSRLDLVRDEQDQKMFGLNSTFKYDSLLPRNSNAMMRNIVATDNSSVLVYENKGVTFNAGLQIQQYQQQFQNTAIRPFRQDLVKLFPVVRINLKGISLAYSSYVIPTSILQLNLIPDSTNPFSIIKGNQDLRPSVQSRLVLSYFKFNVRSKSNMSVSVSYNNTKDDIIMKRMVSAQGIQVTMPANSNRSHGIMSSWNYGKDIKINGSLQYAYNFKVYANFTDRQVFVNDLSEKERILTIVPNLGFSIYKTRSYEFRTDYQFRNYSVSYSTPLLKTSTIAEHNIESSFLLYVTRRVVAESNLVQRYYATANQPKQTLLNQSISWFSKNQSLQAKLTVYDLLNANRNAFSFYNNNVLHLSETNVLKQFAIFSLTYNFKTKK
jgi:hypothetical protein